MALAEAEVTRGRIFVLADRLRSVRDEKRALESDLKRLNEEERNIEGELTELMRVEGVQNFTRNGHMFYTTVRTFVRPKDKEGLFAWLKENGYGSLVQETVNANSLSAWYREFEDDAPEDLADLVEVYEELKIGMRKAGK